MTLKREDGKWCPARISLMCTVVATASGVILALPIAADYLNKAVSPWTTIPAQIHHLDQKVDKIISALNIELTVNSVTNNYLIHTKE